MVCVWSHCGGSGSHCGVWVVKLWWGGMVAHTVVVLHVSNSIISCWLNFVRGGRSSEAVLSAGQFKKIENYKLPVMN